MIKIIKKNKPILFIVLLLTLGWNPQVANAVISCYKICIKGDCDGVIDCAMKKQRDVLEARLDDLINTIKANTKQTKHQTKIIEQEVLAYRRLLERVKKESLSLKEASYLSKKIKDSEALGTSINIIGKGK